MSKVHKKQWQRLVGVDDDGIFGGVTLRASLKVAAKVPGWPKEWVDEAIKANRGFVPEEEAVRFWQGVVGVGVDGAFGPRSLAASKSLLRKAENWQGVKKPEDKAPVVEPEKGRLDPRTLKFLKTLDPAAQPIMRQLCLVGKRVAAAEGLRWVGISGNRTWAEQDALHDIGRKVKGEDVSAKRPMGRTVTKARGGQSTHNFGIAMDFGVFRGRSYLDGAEPKTAARIHKAVYKAAVAAGLDIEWGGNWSSFVDLPHFGVETGLTLRQQRARFAKHGTLFV